MNIGRFSTSFGDPGQVRRALRGFTMIEVVTVAVLMGTLVRVAAPNLHGTFLRARATEVVADIETVRLAAISFRDDQSEWPADAYAGQTPAGLQTYLPDGFSFFRAGYTLDWDNWSLPAGLPTNPSARGLIGVSISTTDAALGQAVLDVIGNSMVSYVLGDVYTFVLVQS